MKFQTATVSSVLGAGQSRNLCYFLFLIFSFFLFLSFCTSEDWGFFAHRRINRLAVFCLPPEMIAFYKKNIEYITEHAVDPDKRRYATRHEAVRHYIDLDHWGSYPFPEVPRDWVDALAKYSSLHLVVPQGDTLLLYVGGTESTDRELISSSPLSASLNKYNPAPMNISRQDYRLFFKDNVMPLYYDDHWRLDCDRLAELAPDVTDVFGCQDVFAVDHFSAYGILPYHLLHMQNRLTEAFRQRSPDRILRLSAEMGHYIGDAHVPLHTTENYNGQLTSQIGIHAFWESRLPELFADDTYDFFVGRAEYIEDPKAFYWQTVLDSHRLVDSVLAIEKELSQRFPQDKQFCYEERLGATIRTQCREYARAYHERLDGMVEERMRKAVHTIACSWYTAWIDAGQPDLSGIGKQPPSKDELELIEELDANYRQGNVKGRKHE